MASPLRSAQRRVRPRYKRRTEGLKGERQGINQAFGRQASSIRGAGGAAEDALLMMAGGLKDAGLKGSYLKQTQADLGQLAQSQEVGVSDMIADARMTRDDDLATVAKALEAARQQRQTAVRSEAEQIRGRRRARQEKEAAKQEEFHGNIFDALVDVGEKAADKNRDQIKAERGRSANLRNTIAEVRARLTADAFGAAGENPDPADVKAKRSEFEDKLRESQFYRRNLVDELLTSGNAPNKRIANEALAILLYGPLAKRTRTELGQRVP